MMPKTLKVKPAKSIDRPLLAQKFAIYNVDAYTGYIVATVSDEAIAKLFVDALWKPNSGFTDRYEYAEIVE